MKTLISKYLPLTIVMAFVFGVALFPVTASAAQVATINSIQGEVMVLEAGAPADALKAATEGQALNSGDSVMTQAGSCAITYADQATIIVDTNTSLIVTEQDKTQDIELKLGKINAQVNKDKVTKPFQVVTPTAVGAVRGTNVDFGFNDQGQLTIDLHDGNLHVYNDEAGMTMDLAGGNKIEINYDAEAGILKVKNDCSSGGPISFSVLGAEYAENPCEEKEINLSTAEGQSGLPDTNVGNDGENEPNENPAIPDEVSPIQ